ncbi:hemolysin D [Marinobacterium nitratireducens]|uniref:Hemolysin D n=2 Tax=Marinobacterium nitratireducens TaxID=518897 RepID=A0A918DXS5_9GAMM|nr:hemolysin D [Marinobacterium nitratireducens]
MSDPVSRPVKLFKVGEAASVRTLEFPGSVMAAQQSDMAFEVSGRIVEKPVTEGELVEEGRVLARLDPRDFEAERDRALAELSAARADFNRYNRAFKANAVTAQELDRARRALRVAEAGLQRAEKAVDDTVLRAPFAGRVARMLVEDFANVQAKQPVMILQSEGALEMRVNVPESEWVRAKRVDSAAQIEINANISVLLSSLPDQPIPARITEFASTADPVTRTFEVTVGFQSPDGLIVSPGMTGRVVYKMPAEGAEAGLLIPADAVVATFDNKPSVWVYDEQTGVVSRRLVTTGELTGASIQVLEGLEPGERIAVSGVHTLTEGFSVHPMEN